MPPREPKYEIILDEEEQQEREEEREKSNQEKRLSKKERRKKKKYRFVFVVNMYEKAVRVRGERIIWYSNIIRILEAEY